MKLNLLPKVFSTALIDDFDSLRKDFMDFEIESQLVVKVGVAEHFVGKAPMRLMTMALGSCLGIVLYDPVNAIGGLAHAMHPRRNLVRRKSNRSKFVDTAIEVMLSKMERLGAKRNDIVAKLFGGARMFDSFKDAAGVMQIGSENVIVARKVLSSLSIPIVSESVGGSKGRTIVLDLEDGTVKVRYADNSEELY